jgi:hypothetical protein
MDSFHLLYAMFCFNSSLRLTDWQKYRSKCILVRLLQKLGPKKAVVTTVIETEKPKVFEATEEPVSEKPEIKDEHGTDFSYFDVNVDLSRPSSGLSVKSNLRAL